MRAFLLSVLSLAALLGIFLYMGRHPGPVTSDPEPSAPQTAPSALPKSPSHNEAPAPSVATSRQEAGWKKFSERFGGELKPTFTPDGHLASIQGAPGLGNRASPDFRPEDPQKAIARAREVLEAARDLLGVEADLPLESPIAKGNSVSTQVYFQESYQGEPVAPFGSVSVDLGQQGEVLNLSSDYVPGIHVVNEPKIGAEQAKNNAVAAIGDQSSALHPIGGNQVIWVTRQTPSGVPEGRHAYEYTVQGRRVIVDASNGEILERRDRRQF